MIMYVCLYIITYICLKTRMGFNCPRLHGLRRLDLGVLCLLGLMREGSQGIIRWELNGSENGGFGP